MDNGRPNIQLVVDCIAVLDADRHLRTKLLRPLCPPPTDFLLHKSYNYSENGLTLGERLDRGVLVTCIKRCGSWLYPPGRGGRLLACIALPPSNFGGR